MSIGSFLGNLVNQVAGQAATSAGTAIGNGITGGSAGLGCPHQTPTEIASLVLRSLTASERAQLVKHLNATNNGGLVSLSNPERIASSAAGGDDCKATSATGKAYAAYWDSLVSKYSAGSSSIWIPDIPPVPGTTQANGSIFNGQPIGNQGAVITAPVGSPVGGTYDPNYWTNLGNDLFFGGGGGTGATPGPATGSSVFYGPVPATTPSGSPPLTVGSTTLWLIGGGVIVFLLVLVVLFGGGRK